ncbi:MAG: tandem-95 repeat protein [Blastocatellia bacterium]|nr:tandem-95 repeat protein [Blastocatellia bacterium]
MRNPLSLLTLGPLVLALSVIFIFSDPSIANAQITYGTLDNFDVINDTGGDCHGFEIELEGISVADVAYTFGAPYQRYGDPVVVPNASGTGVIIRYTASYDPSSHTWSATTPFTAPPYLPTQGHSCWTGGVADPAEYYSCGCDHFGASLNASPTRTSYHWLVESSPGVLSRFGSSVPLPAPTWNVTPPAVPGAQPIAAAVIAPPPPDAYEFGDAIWAKVFVTELPDGLQEDDLNHMVIDDPDRDIVPDEPAEVEIEWVLLQASTENEGEQEFGGAAEVGEGAEAVSRRFEFYAYTGVYDAETHEARCDNPDVCPEAVGILIGTQNVAVNLAGPLSLNSDPVANTDNTTVAEDGILVVRAATLLANDTDADGDVLSVVSVQSPVNGLVALMGTDVVFTPTADFNGGASFTYTASDGKGGASTATVNVTVTPVNDVPVANAGPDQTLKVRNTVTLSGDASSDVDGDALTYGWTLTVKPAHSKATLSGAATAHPTFYADKPGTYVITLVVNDGTVSSSPDTVTVTVTKK